MLLVCNKMMFAKDEPADEYGIYFGAGPIGLMIEVMVALLER